MRFKSHRWNLAVHQSLQSTYQAIFNLMYQKWGTPDLDILTSSLNNKLSLFIARSTNRLMLGSDALITPWSQFRLQIYVFHSVWILPCLLRSHPCAFYFKDILCPFPLKNVFFKVYLASSPHCSTFLHSWNINFGFLCLAETTLWTLQGYSLRWPFLKSSLGCCRLGQTSVWVGSPLL